MKIYGFQKTTLLDYPEHVAATVFTGGCNFRCPYCQNSGLVLLSGNGQGQTPAEIPEEEVLAHLRKRRGILDGVCISGGEPALQPDLEEFIRKVRKLGYAVKLDSNGYRPDVLKRLLEEKLLDYVAMDIKACEENYARAAGLERCGTLFEPERIRESMTLLRQSGIAYEFRTTAVKGIHTVEEFDRIGEMIAGCLAYYIQNYRESGEVLDAAGLSGFEAAELLEMKRLAGRHVERVEIRGEDEEIQKHSKENI
ncbi:MAG: anaerobic ribonucleoside-triphosphate reductase activating protein [Muribaculum sp.]|nr:anaerobic ribonucleoside-triphosphate reductase activating protein [Muribaculum sp.]